MNHRVPTSLVFLVSALVPSLASAQGGTRTVAVFSGASAIDSLLDRRDVLYFSARTTSSNQSFHLYRSDGTAAGTRTVTTSPPDVRRLTLVGETIFFSGWDLQYGAELWKTDGTAAGTVLVKDIWPGGGNLSSSPNWLTPLGNLLLFAADDPSSPSSRLWVSDGTTAGTQQIGPSISYGLLPQARAILGTTLFFAGLDSAGVELWKTDGTAAGTSMLVDINPGSSSSDPTFPTPFQGQLYFIANDGVNGFEIWRTDGTAAGTMRAVPSSVVASPKNLCVSGPWIYFNGHTNAFGMELWRTDGTAANTKLVKDIDPVDSDPRCLTDLNGTLVFYASTRNEGYELWRSDGTDLGTFLLKDINPGGGSLMMHPPLPLPRVGSRFVYFSARDGAMISLWRSDGTIAGTTRVDGPPTFSSPVLITQAVGDAFFAADVILRHNLLAFDAGATAKSHAVGCGGGGRQPTLSATDPVLGGNMSLGGGGALPGSFSIVLLGRSAATPVPMGSCLLYLDPSVLLALVAVAVQPAGDWTVGVPIPNDAALREVRVGLQAAFTPTNGPFGLDFSNDVFLNLGS